MVQAFNSDLCEFENSLHSELEDCQGYIVRPPISEERKKRDYTQDMLGDVKDNGDFAVSTLG